MTLSIIAFIILIIAFTIGVLTRISAGLLAFVAAFGVGALLAGVPINDVIGLFPAGLFLILTGATLLFGIVKNTGTIDLLAYWAERLAGRHKLLVPVLMFLLTAVLCTAGAFTPAAVAMVAPVALALGSRFGINALAMGLVVVQGANAGAFSPVNPFGVVSNLMLDEAGASGETLTLYIYCFVFNALLAAIGYVVVGWIIDRRAGRTSASAAGAAGAGAAGGSAGQPEHPSEGSGSVATATATKTAPVKVEVTPMRMLTLTGLVALLALTTVMGINVGVASLVIALVLIMVKPSVQDPTIKGMPWSTIILVTGIVTYVGLLEEIGALEALQAGLEQFGNSSVAALVASYVVAVVSAFASTTATLTVVTPVVVPIVADPMLTPIGVVTAISISSSVVDTSPMSTAGALLMTSAPPGQERSFFKALLLWAIAMVGIVPLVVWGIFVVLL